MRMRARTQYLFRNTPVRTQRSRIEALNNQTPSATNWPDFSAFLDEEGTTGFVRVLGFTANTTLLVSVPQNVTFANVGTFSVVVSPNASLSNIKYTAIIPVAAIGTTVTPVPISPGDYVTFYAICSDPATLTVTVKDKPTARTLDTFTATIS